MFSNLAKSRPYIETLGCQAADAHSQTAHGSHPHDVFLAYRKEKGGKEKELPVHHKLEELLDQYLKISGL
jgi:hypothetical protein